MTKTFIDLFSGAGGMSCGLEQAGFKCVLGIDQDKASLETFQANHHHANIICGDLREIKLEDIYTKIDVVGLPVKVFQRLGRTITATNVTFYSLNS
jgi:DNA (cytosine-5)-methyltransferase 1